MLPAMHTDSAESNGRRDKRVNGMGLQRGMHGGKKEIVEARQWKRESKRATST